MLEEWREPLIFVYDEIGPEGWVAILRATEYLPDSAWDVTIRCERTVLAAGRRDDLRAIWGKIHCWWLDSGEEGTASPWRNRVSDGKTHYAWQKSYTVAKVMVYGFCHVMAFPIVPWQNPWMQ